MLGWLCVALIILGNIVSIGVNHRYLINTDVLCGPKPAWLDLYGEHGVCVQKEKTNIALIRTLVLDFALVTGWRLWYDLAEKCVCIWDIVRNGMSLPKVENPMPTMDSEKKLVAVTCSSLLAWSMVHHVPWARWLALAGVMYTVTRDAEKIINARKGHSLTLLSKASCAQQPMIMNAILVMFLAVIVTISASPALSLISDADVARTNTRLKELVCPTTTVEEKRYFDRSSFLMTWETTQDVVVKPYVGVPTMIVRTHVRRYLWDHAFLSAWCNIALFCFFMSVLVLSNNKPDILAALGKLGAGIGTCVEFLWETVLCCGHLVTWLTALFGLGSIAASLVGYIAGETLVKIMIWGISGFVWCVHWICYMCAFLHWLDDPNKMSMVLVTGAACFAIFMLRYNTWLLLFWVYVYVTQDKNTLWCPRTFVEACTYWTRASVLYCCAVQLSFIVPFKQIVTAVYVVLTTGW